MKYVTEEAAHSEKVKSEKRKVKSERIKDLNRGAVGSL
jgi:hypothetical protein